MKAQSEATMFSGYPLTAVDTKQKKAELIVVKPSEMLPLPLSKISVANDPENWDVDWFSNYE